VRRGGRSRKLWVPRSSVRLPPPRLVQLLAIARCARWWHKWGRWRRETEDWFEYVDAPVLWAWRCCTRCGLLEQVAPPADTDDNAV
jgi:hypothetical protein